MTTFRPRLLLGLLAALSGAARGAEQNIWPFWVGQTAGAEADRVTSWTAAGPLLFYQPIGPSGKQDAAGFRPFYVRRHNPDDPEKAGDEYFFLYPLFSYRRAPDEYRWSVFQLINHYGPKAGRPADSVAPPDTGFDVWPFYFSRQTSSPDTSYHAVFPIAGSVPYRFGMDRWTWFLFPLYGKFEKRGVTTTTTPWPFIKVLEGEGNHGFAFWPLFGWREKSGAYHQQFYLWPLIYKNENDLWLAQPDVKLGFLPFYARETNADARSETYLWPFFGYTDRTGPVPYHENRYFWPLLVQGRGEERYVNRWAPFYTHSVIKGTDKTWYGWPLWRREFFTDNGLVQTTSQFLFFVYHRTEQRSATNPALASAHKTHLWPLVTIWDNGAGHKQVQAFSPLEVFFSSNDVIQLTYSPLFAVYRYDRQGNDRVRYSVLWDFVTYRRQPETREFHVGPLFSSVATPAGRRLAVGNGLFGVERRGPDGGWRFFAFDFKRRSASSADSP